MKGLADAAEVMMMTPVQGLAVQAAGLVLAEGLRITEAAAGLAEVRRISEAVVTPAEGEAVQIFKAAK